MAYIGVQPTDTYLSIASQQITGTGSATYTLDYSVSNEEDVAVFVNNVRQNVSTYTVSSNQLTLGGTISASDSCWVLFLGRTVGTKTPAVGSVTNDMLAGSIANAKLANSSITLNGSAVSLGGSASVFNTPAFHAYCNTTTSASNNTLTIFKVDTEEFDTDNCYNTGTYTFQPTTAGKYYVYVSAKFGNTIDFNECFAGIYMNGTTRVARSQFRAEHSPTYNVGRIIEFNGTTDYVQPFVFQNSGGTENFSTGAEYSFFGGYKLIGA